MGAATHTPMGCVSGGLGRRTPSSTAHSRRTVSRAVWQWCSSQSQPQPQLRYQHGSGTGHAARSSWPVAHQNYQPI